LSILLNSWIDVRCCLFKSLTHRTYQAELVIGSQIGSKRNFLFL